MSLIAQTQTGSTYTELLARVKAAGLLNKQPRFYVIRLAVISAVAGALWVGAGFLGLSNVVPQWAEILIAFAIAGLLGIISAQYGFIAHEAAHRMVFRNNKWNDRLGLVLANLFAGLSYGFWMRKHNKHHQRPNQIDQDPDIAIRILSFTVESRDQKRGLERWMSNRQGYLFPFLLFLTGFDLLLDSFQALGRTDKPKRQRALEFGLMVVRQTGPYVAMGLMFGWLWAIALWVFMMMIFGFFMGAAFAPNHKGMPLVPRDMKLDFFERQVLTSRNIRGSWLKDNLMGGLNYQVEHHLFPSMARPYLKKAHEIVEQYCAEMDVTLVEMNLIASYKVIITYLNKVGLSGNADPFVCPMVATLRPRY
ncbi:fatty acid desaturase [Microbacteriaceae bacterium MWH-Ta3]|nr:fatty acid desaturase [Microbacteriaceae bacterium MWH-Ta3]